MAGENIRLSRDELGRLVLTTDSGEVHRGVVPVRAFPVCAPDEGISLVSAEGAELAWFERLSGLPAESLALIEEELERREFMPEIRRLRRVSTFATPSTWDVETDRGDTSFVLKGEEDIRRLAGNTLMISDSHGIHFLIRDMANLDRTSRKLLDRFL